MTVTLTPAQALTTALATATKPGTVLPNGAILLAAKLLDRRKDGNEYVILALSPGSFQPFVTWKRFVGVQRTATGSYETQDYCVAGGYHRELDDAIADYKERA